MSISIIVDSLLGLPVIEWLLDASLPCLIVAGLGVVLLACVLLPGRRRREQP